ncbi:peptidylprolyl isomerase [Candidatus Woesearchaeota archaeon]|nr:peptidylprolyl isomerase [Candidatus Woesearchaeota archaeon]
MAKKTLHIKKRTIKKKKARAEKAKAEADYISFPVSRIIILGFIVIVLIGVIFGSKYLLRKPGSSTIAATVNGESLYWADIDARYERLTPEYQAVLTREMILNQTIDELVILQLAEQAGVEIPREDLDSLITRVVMQFGEEEFNRRLEDQGIDAVEFRKQLEDTLKINEFLGQELDELRITDEDAQEFFDDNKELLSRPETVHAYHILFETEEDAEAALERLEAGEDFEELARELSIGPSAPNGGDIGYISQEMVVPEFGDAAFELEIEEISDIVESEYGFHIIKITDRKPAEEAVFDDLKSLIKFNLFDTRFRENQELVRDYINQARANAEIEVFERN